MTTNTNSKTTGPTNEPTEALEVEAATLATTRRRTSAAWIAGGTLWATAGLLYAESGWRFRASSATFLAADVLIFAAIAGLLLLRPHGFGRPATAALAVALIARVGFAVAEVSGLITGTDDTVLLPIAGLLTGVSTIAFGVLARLADRRLRAIAIAVGLYFFVVMMPIAVTTGEPPPLALAGWGLPIALIGLTLGRSRSARRNDHLVSPTS